MSLVNITIAACILLVYYLFIAQLMYKVGDEWRARLISSNAEESKCVPPCTLTPSAMFSIRREHHFQVYMTKYTFALLRYTRVCCYSTNSAAWRGNSSHSTSIRSSAGQFRDMGMLWNESVQLERIGSSVCNLECEDTNIVVRPRYRITKNSIYPL